MAINQAFCLFSHVPSRPITPSLVSALLGRAQSEGWHVACLCAPHLRAHLRTGEDAGYALAHLGGVLQASVHCPPQSEPGRQSGAIEPVELTSECQGGSLQTVPPGSLAYSQLPSSAGKKLSEVAEMISKRKSHCPNHSWKIIFIW